MVIAVVKDDDDLTRSLTATRVTVHIRLSIGLLHEAMEHRVRMSSDLNLSFFHKSR